MGSFMVRFTLMMPTVNHSKLQCLVFCVPLMTSASTTSGSQGRKSKYSERLA
jgi:hypothetical protein